MNKKPIAKHRLKKKGMKSEPVAKYWLKKLMPECFVDETDRNIRNLVAAFMAFDEIYETDPLKSRFDWFDTGSIITVDYNRKQVIDIAKKYGGKLTTHDVPQLEFAFYSYGIFDIVPGSCNRRRSFFSRGYNHPRNQERRNKRMRREKLTPKMLEWLKTILNFDLDKSRPNYATDAEALKRAVSEIGDERARVQIEGSDSEITIWKEFERKLERRVGAPKAKLQRRSDLFDIGVADEAERDFDESD